MISSKPFFQSRDPRFYTGAQAPAGSRLSHTIPLAWSSSLHRNSPGVPCNAVRLYEASCRGPRAPEHPFGNTHLVEDRHRGSIWSEEQARLLPGIRDLAPWAQCPPLVTQPGVPSGLCHLEGRRAWRTGADPMIPCLLLRTWASPLLLTQESPVSHSCGGLVA